MKEEKTCFFAKIYDKIDNNFIYYSWTHMCSFDCLKETALNHLNLRKLNHLILWKYHKEQHTKFSVEEFWCVWKSKFLFRIIFEVIHSENFENVDKFLMCSWFSKFNALWFFSIKKLTDKLWASFDELADARRTNLDDLTKTLWTDFDFINSCLWKEL